MYVIHVVDRKLRELNVEGNQLTALPVGMLRLRRLESLRVRNNFLHPLFWKESSRNTPQVRCTRAWSFL